LVSGGPCLLSLISFVAGRLSFDAYKREVLGIVFCSI
jgi:hypothetical protein